MTRGLTAGAISASQAASAGVIVLVEMLLDSGAVRVCSAAADISWNGYTWSAVGQLGKLNPIREAETGQISGAVFELSSIPSDYLTHALTENYQGRTVNIYVAFLALPQHSLVANPVLEWSGTLDMMSVQDDATSGAIQVTAETALFDFARAVPVNWSDSEQQAMYPGDIGMQYVPQMATKQLVWPAAAWFEQQ